MQDSKLFPHLPYAYVRGTKWVRGCCVHEHIKAIVVLILPPLPVPRVLVAIFGPKLCLLEDDSKKLGFYGVQSGMEVRWYRYLRWLDSDQHDGW